MIPKLAGRLNARPLAQEYSELDLPAVRTQRELPPPNTISHDDLCPVAVRIEAPHASTRPAFDGQSARRDQLRKAKYNAPNSNPANGKTSHAPMTDQTVAIISDTVATSQKALRSCASDSERLRFASNTTVPLSTTGSWRMVYPKRRSRLH
jgi:hypothetical protein